MKVTKSTLSTNRKTLNLSLTKLKSKYLESVTRTSVRIQSSRRQLDSQKLETISLPSRTVMMFKLTSWSCFLKLTHLLKEI